MGCVFEGGAQGIKGRQDSHGLEAELISEVRPIQVVKSTI